MSKKPEKPKSRKAPAAKGAAPAPLGASQLDLDELSAIRRLALAVEMAIDGSVSLDPSERAALDEIASLVSHRMAALVEGGRREPEVA